MTFLFKQASSVVVGTLNMYILHPQWLIDHQIIPDDTKVAIQSSLDKPGIRLHFPSLKCIWTVEPTRLQIQTDDFEFDCGELTGKVLHRLPETPIIAVGSNSTYIAPLDDLESLLTLKDFPSFDELLEDGEISQRTFHVAVERPNGAVANLQLSVTDDEVELALNVHTDQKDKPIARNAVAPAQRFVADQQDARSLAHKLFGAEISYATSNH